MDTIKWYQSRTVIGALVSIVCTVIQTAGVAVAPDVQGSITDIILQLGSVAGAAFAVYGRLKVTKPIAR